MQFGLFLSLVLCLVGVAVTQDEPLATTKLGKIKGSILKTIHGNEFKAFRGIRYAQAPVDDKRFRAPVSVPKWGDSVLDATKDGKHCPQPYIPNELMSEDCLILNVYTRDLTGNKTVLVYIHGGGNFMGSSDSETDAGPEYLMNHDIVLVTFNYRLGALGFASTQTQEAPGNYAFLDQVMALQWVQDHVSNFGGNPESVTISGLSAGGMAVTVLMASPLTKGLFHKALVMSGSATNHFHVDNMLWTQQLARETGCPRYNPKDTIECLRKVSWEKIIEVCERWESYGFINMKWSYEVDGNFLLDTPTNVFAKGDFHKVPIMAGLTKDELTHYYYRQENNTGLLNDISENFDKYAPELFMLNPEDNSTLKSNRIKEFYLKDKKIQEQPFDHFGLIFADAVVGHGHHRLLELARKHVDVYQYRFDYMGRYSYFPDPNGIVRGVGHGDDYQYLFGSSMFQSNKIKPGDPEMFLVDRSTKWWTSFAENGVPSDENGVKWLPSNKSNVFTMFIDKDIRLADDEPFKDRYQLWDQLFPIKT